MVPLALSIAAFPGAHWVVRLHTVLLLGTESLESNLETASVRDQLAATIVEAEEGGDPEWVLSKLSSLRLVRSDRTASVAALGRRFASQGLDLEHPSQRAKMSEQLEYLALRGLSDDGTNSYFSMLLATSAVLVGDDELLLASLDHVRRNVEYRDYTTFEPVLLQRWQRRQLGYLGERIGAPFSVNSIQLGHLAGLEQVAAHVVELDSPTAASVAVLSLTQRIFDNSRYAGEIRASGGALRVLAVGDDSPTRLEHTTLAFRHEMNPVSRGEYVASTLSLAERVRQSNLVLRDLLNEREVETGDPLAGSRRRALGLLVVVGAAVVVGFSWPLGWLLRRLPGAGPGIVATCTVGVLCHWMGATGKWLPALALLAIPVALEAAARRFRLGPVGLCGAAIVAVACGGLTVLSVQQSGMAPWLTTVLGFPCLVAGAVALAAMNRSQWALVLVPLSVSVAGYIGLVGLELRDNASFAAMQSRWRYDVMLAKRSAEDVPPPSTDRQVG